MNLFEIMQEWDGFMYRNQIVARHMLDFVQEAWAPKEKEEVVRQAKAQGYDLIDNKVIGDYDLTLWHTNLTVGNCPGGFYGVSINSGQANPLSPDDQLSRPDPGPFPFRAVADQIDRWVSGYLVMVRLWLEAQTKKGLSNTCEFSPGRSGMFLFLLSETITLTGRL